VHGARRLHSADTPPGHLRGLALAGAGGAALWTIAHNRSAAVRHWKLSSLPRIQIGPLSCRVGGTGATGALLLHGLVATGDVFGNTADLLAASRVVAVPDLLGFGQSLDEGRDDFGTSAHLAAIDAVVARTLGDRPLVIAAHSMGSTLALRWAALHPDRVEQVICLGPPIWPGRAAARRAIGNASAMSRIFVLQERTARRACAISCRHRSVAGWIAAAVAPRWPIPIAWNATRHTWAAYSQTLEAQVLHDDWPALLHRLDQAGVPVRLVWGDHDRVGDHDYAQELASALVHGDVRVVAGADHTLPAARPELIVQLAGQPAGGPQGVLAPGAASEDTQLSGGALRRHVVCPSGPDRTLPARVARFVWGRVAGMPAPTSGTVRASNAAT
jgi:pimeloyl-ACP methyl ester carboxylesterase